MADETHQEDPTTSMSIDQKITPNTATAPMSFDIHVSVVPGHDMVINHLDGSQELGTGNEMIAVTSAEAESGDHVPLSTVQGSVPAETTHRSIPDPEVTIPSPVMDTASVTDEAPSTDTPEPTSPEAETPAEDPAPEVEATDPTTPSDESTADDVEGV